MKNFSFYEKLLQIFNLSYKDCKLCKLKLFRNTVPNKFIFLSVCICIFLIQFLLYRIEKIAVQYEGQPEDALLYMNKDCIFIIHKFYFFAN